MLPIRFASSGFTRFGCGLLLLLLLGGAFLDPVEAAPLKALGVDQFRELIDPKNDPLPEPAALAAYRRKLRRAAEDLPSLGEVASVLLLSEWNLVEFGSERVSLDQVRKAVRERNDDAFQGDVRKLMARDPDNPGYVRDSIVAEIKHDTRRQLLLRLESRTRFYLRQGRNEDRIAVANLIGETMTASRRQNLPGAEIAAAKRGMPLLGENVSESARQLRHSFRALADDLRRQLASANPQVQVAGARALSKLEIPTADLLAALKPLLVSPQTDVVARLATMEALGQVLELTEVQMERDRPQPPLEIVEQILPVASLGLDDSDAEVRRASLTVCHQAARIVDDLASEAVAAGKSRAAFQSVRKVVFEVLPKLNATARDPVPTLRVTACRVLETFALAALRMQGRYGRRPPSPLPEPKKPDNFPPKGGGKKIEGQSQPRPAVTLERPIKLPDGPVRPASYLAEARPHPVSVGPASRQSRHGGTGVSPVAFAPPVDELPLPAPFKAELQGTVQAMITDLRDRDYRVRLATVDVLETIGDRAEPAIPALVKALKDSNKFVRWASARTLGRFATRAKDNKNDAFFARRADEVVSGLMPLLNDNEDPSVRVAALEALEEYGGSAKKAVPLLARVINRGNKDYILAVLHTLQGIGSDAARALPNVAWLLSDRLLPASVRIEAAQTLGRFGKLARNQPRVLPVLREVMLNDPDDDVRNAASTAILAIDRPLK